MLALKCRMEKLAIKRFFGRTAGMCGIADRFGSVPKGRLRPITALRPLPTVGVLASRSAMRRLAAGGPDIQAERQVFTFPGAESDPYPPDGLLQSGRSGERRICEFRFRKPAVGQLVLPAIMHSSQLCAVMLGDRDRSRACSGFARFGLPEFWT